MNIEPNPIVPGDAPPGADDDHNKLILDWAEPGGRHVREARRIARELTGLARAVEAERIVADRPPMDVARQLSQLQAGIDTIQIELAYARSARARSHLAKTLAALMEAYAKVSGTMGSGQSPASVTVVRVDQASQRRLLDDPEYRRRALALEAYTQEREDAEDGGDGDRDRDDA